MIRELYSGVREHRGKLSLSSSSTPVMFRLISKGLQCVEIKPLTTLPEMCIFYIET
jgi:hypothetical protein